MTPLTMDSRIATVGGAKSPKIEKGLGIRTVGDLLLHFPRRYLPTGELTEVGTLKVDQQLMVVGRIVRSDLRTYQDRRTHRTAYRVEAVLGTNGPSLRMTFFAKKHHIATWQVERLAPGAEGVFTGKVSRFKDSWQLTNPQMVLFAEAGGQDSEAAASLAASVTGLFPVYPSTAGVESWDLQRAIHFALDMVEHVPEVLPETLRRERRLLDIRTALRWIHQPEDHRQRGAAEKRFRFEEALVTQLVMARRRAAVRRLGARPRLGEDGGLLAAFDARLPFELTGGQREVGIQLDSDLAAAHPMHRLLQGEVGSGKTVVALRAMLRTIDSGGQAALLAPTEVLAQQHYRSITAMLGDLAAGGMLGGAEEGTTVALLTGSLGVRARRETMLRIASGEAGIVIGTHALLEERVSFADLGLVVVDEQHRFGVEQRAALTEKSGSPPHVLVMTATPIPRTVAMTVFGDLEISTLTELPAGRATIQSNVVPARTQPGWLDRVWERVVEEVGRGHQVYVVCPRIGGDEAEEGQVDPFVLDEGDGGDEGDEGTAPTAPLTAVEQLAPELEGGALSNVGLAVLHGRLPAEEKDRVMRAFAAGDVDVLVSTTVIEVGVDVPNATVMVVMDADRFGVSQLHQLRGRVGRGGLPGLCLLVTNAEPESAAMERLYAVASTTDGFALSRIDLEQRREGDVLGASQSGFRSGLRRLSVIRDEDTIVEARTEAELLLAADPTLASLPALAEAVEGLETSRQGDFMEKA